MRNTRREECEESETRAQPDNAGCDNPFSLRAVIAAFLQIRIRQTPPK